MLPACILWLWTLTTPSALQLHPEPHPLLLSRLDHLEALLVDHQVQWQQEKRVLTEELHLLRKEKQEMREQIEGLQNTQTAAQAVMDSLQIQTLTLTEENGALKTRLEEVHRQLVSMTRTQPSLQDPVTPCGTTPRPDREGDGEGGGIERHEEYKNLTVPVKESSPHQHVRPARSDDQVPLEAVTNRLAQQMTLISADVQAVKTQLADDVGVLKTQLTADIQALKTQHTVDVQALKTSVASVAHQHYNIKAAGGSTYVHWGSSTCAGSSQLVYAGVVGGSWYAHSGAAANALCVTLSPNLQDWPSGVSSSNFLYGAEYEAGGSHQNEDAVCAVCRSPQPTTIMVPGTNVCSAGWTLQYSGFIMAGYHAFAAATEFICVDTTMEGRAGSQADSNGYLLYYTKTHCGSLACPPYQTGKLLTCAVCSK